MLQLLLRLKKTEHSQLLERAVVVYVPQVCGLPRPVCDPRPFRPPLRVTVKPFTVKAKKATLRFQRSVPLKVRRRLSHRQLPPLSPLEVPKLRCLL